MIRLKTHQFDPLVQMPILPGGLGYGRPHAGEDAYHIVQFKDRVVPAMRRDLEQSGAVIMHYVHENAFIVRATGDAIERVAQLPLVRWIGLFEPAYKLDPHLDLGYDAVLNQQIEARRRLGAGRSLEPVDTSSRLAVHILTMERRMVGEVAQAVGRAGGAGIERSDFGSGLVRADIPRASLERLARERGVLWIERELPAEVDNDIARWTIQSYDSGSMAAPAHQHQVTGMGQIVTISDSGLDHGHAAFRDPNVPNPAPGHRKVTAYYVPPGATGDNQDNGDTQHGTHVCGSVAGDAGVVGQYDGDGVNSGDPAQEKLELHDGQAFEATIHLQDISNDPDGKAVYPSADLSNHYAAATSRSSWINTNSWGTVLGLGEYLSGAVQTDTFIWNQPAFSVVFSAGNRGPGAGTINPFGVAKNVIAVGASANGSDGEDLAFTSRYFSSRGPTVDGRIKPDLLAPGESLWSARGCDDSFQQFPPDPVCDPGDADTYKALNGTSMAAPTVAGAVALVRQYYMGGWYPTGDPATGTPLTSPSAALIKATLINSAAEMMAPEAYANGETRYPNNNQGWGRILLDDTLYFADDVRSLVIDDNPGVTSDPNGDRTHTYQFNVGSRFNPFEVTLAWSDRPRTAPTGPDLVNDLDLIVTSPNGMVYRGNAFQGYRPGQSKPNALPDEADHLNNVEEVLVLSNLQPGTWTIQVYGYNVPMGNAQNRQPYAVVLTGLKTTSRGLVEMDRPEYLSNHTVIVAVSDSDHNQNPAVPESITAQIASDTETSPVTVTLTEVGSDSGVFEGTVPLQSNPIPIPSDPYLQAQNGDTITASYFDAGDGEGGSGMRQAFSTVDETPPIISNVTVAETRPTRAEITWTTDEPADTGVDYGASLPLTEAAASDLFTMSHFMELRGLQPGVTYRFRVRSTDDLGNQGIADNAGQYYVFATTGIPPSPPLSSEWPTYQNNSARRGASSSMMVPPVTFEWSKANNTLFVKDTSPVVSGGIVYTSEDGYVRARQAIDGTLLWQRLLGIPNAGGSTPAVSGTVVYVPLMASTEEGNRGFLYALNTADGNSIWTAPYTYALDYQGIDPSFKIAVDAGRVFTLAYEGRTVIAVDALTGLESWTRTLSPASALAHAGVAVGDGKVYVPWVVGGQVGITALDQETGWPQWSRDQIDFEQLPGHVPLFAESTVYLGTGKASTSYSGTMTALNATDGTIRWQVTDLDQISHSTPAYDGSTIYFASTTLGSGGDIGYQALDAATGEGLWFTLLPSIPYGTSGSLVYADGFLYGVADDGVLRALDAATGQIVDSMPLGESTSSAHLAVSDRRLFVESTLGTLYAFEAPIDPDSDDDGDPDGSDCAPADPSRRHGAIELCNGFDDNCIGGVDEGFGQTTCGVGACQRTVQNCFNGQFQSCVPGSPGIESVSAPETCFDGIDNNCDGMPDLDCSINIVAGSQILGGGATIVYGGETYLHGQSINNTYEEIQEGGSGSNRTLTTVWTYATASIPSGTLCELRVEGTRGTANDTFPFHVVKRTGTNNCTLGESWPSGALLTLVKTTDDDRPQIGDLGPVSQTYCVRMTDSLPSGDSQADIVALDRVFVFPTPVSVSESTQMGAVVAPTDFRSTVRSDDVRETLQEALINDVSRLRHTWRFDSLPPGTNRKLHIEGNRTAGSDKDNFQFSVSTSTQVPPPDASFVPITGALISSGNDTANGTDYPFTYYSPFYTTIWIRVDDTKTTSGTALSTLFLDHLAVKTVP